MIRFTKDEKKVVLFLLVALLTGISVIYYKKINPPKHIFINIEEDEIINYKKININIATTKDLVKLKKYLYEGASERFEKFLHGPPHQVLKLF